MHNKIKAKTAEEFEKEEMHKIQNLNDIKMFDTNPEKELDKFESMKA